MSEVLTLDDLTPYLLLKNGNFLYKVPFRGGWAVLKVYYDSRGWFARLRKSFGNVVLHGQTSYMPQGRRQVELDCINLWKAHGFRVFEVFEDIEVRAPTCVPGGYTLMEYVQAPKLVDLLGDDSRPFEERAALYRRFLKEWSRRHDLAIAESEPRLVHENGDVRHVMAMPDGAFLWFDFEMVYRKRSRVADFISREIVQYLWEMNKMLPADLAARFLDETVAHYPSRDRLHSAWRYWLKHPNPLRRFVRWLDRVLKPRSRKPTSKYNVARRLREKLG